MSMPEGPRVRTAPHTGALVPGPNYLEPYLRRRMRYRTHVAAWFLSSVALTVMGGLMDGQPEPGLALGLMWGVVVGIHHVRFKGWVDDHRLLHGESLLDERSGPLVVLQRLVELFLRPDGRSPAVTLKSTVQAIRLKLDVPAGPLPPSSPASLATAAPSKALPRPSEPLLTRCEQAAARTEQRLESLKALEPAAQSVIREGLERVQELMAYRQDIHSALEDAEAESLEADRERLERRIDSVKDGEAQRLYEVQLSMVNARAYKVTTLRALEERIDAYAEGYLAALTSLRMDAVCLRGAELATDVGFRALLEPVQQLEQQVEAMRAAALEVARVVR